MGANSVTTLTFTLPIWINPPAKVKRQSIIQIHSNIITLWSSIK